MDDWQSPHNFWKQFLSGAFIVIVMTGLDQDMMQKNLTCRTLREAQKDMCSYGVAFVPANLLFLSLGILLAQLFESQGVSIPTKGDELLPMFVSGAANHSPFTLDLRSSLLSLGIAQTSLALLSLNRSLHPSPFTIRFTFVLDVPYDDYCGVLQRSAASRCPWVNALTITHRSPRCSGH
jgi:hypothetical protein